MKEQGIIAKLQASKIENMVDRERPLGLSVSFALRFG